MPVECVLRMAIVAFKPALLIINSFAFCSRAPSPRSTRGDPHSVVERSSKLVDSPGSISPSVHSSDERPRSRAASHQFRPQSQHSRSGFISFFLHNHSTLSVPFAISVFRSRCRSAEHIFRLKRLLFFPFHIAIFEAPCTLLVHIFHSS